VTPARLCTWPSASRPASRASCSRNPVREGTPTDGTGRVPGHGPARARSRGPRRPGLPGRWRASGDQRAGFPGQQGLPGDRRATRRTNRETPLTDRSAGPDANASEMFGDRSSVANGASAATRCLSVRWALMAAATAVASSVVATESARAGVVVHHAHSGMLPWSFGGVSLRFRESSSRSSISRLRVSSGPITSSM